MTQNDGQYAQPELATTLDRGRREGFAIAAIVLSFVSFINLLGAEKSILAITLAVLALSGSKEESARRRSFIAIGLSLLQILTILVVILIFRDQFGELIRLLHRLG